MCRGTRMALPTSQPLAETKWLRHGQRVEQVPCRSGKAVEASDHEHVAGLQPVERLAELGSVGLGAARHLAEHLRASRFGELAHLRLDALSAGRDPGVAVDHA